MNTYIKLWKGRIATLFLWFIRCLFLIVIPTMLLWELLPHTVEVFPLNTFRVHLEKRGTDWYRQVGLNAHLIDNGLLLYGSDKPDIQFVPLDAALTIPKTLIAKLLKLPDEPIKHKLCFHVKSYFSGSGTVRIPVENFSVWIMLKSGKLIEARDNMCIDQIDGAVMMGVAPGAFMMDDLYSALNQVGSLSLSGAALQFEQARPLTGGTVVNYAVDGDYVFLNGTWFKGRIEKDAKNNLKVFVDANDPNANGGIDGIQELMIDARPRTLDLIVLAIVILAGWWVIAFSFMDSFGKVWRTTICPVGAWSLRLALKAVNRIKSWYDSSTKRITKAFHRIRIFLATWR